MSTCISFLRRAVVALLVWSLPAIAQPRPTATISDQNSILLSRAVPLAQRSVALRDHKMTMVRIRRPHLQSSVPTPPVLPSVEEQATEARRATKTACFASFTATIYPGPVTELCWQAGERTFRAYSNIDFRTLDTVSEIETDSAVVSWFCMPMDGGDDTLPASLRQRLALSARSAEYVVDATEAEMDASPEAFVVLDAIHAYFDAHRRQLVAEHAQRLAMAEARAAELAAHPPAIPDTTVYFWSDEPDSRAR